MVNALPGMEAALNPVDEAQIKADLARQVFEASLRDEDGQALDADLWVDDYFALLAEGWPWRVAVYMLWASLPGDRRQPRTQAELATQYLGLTSDRVIRTWKQNNPAIEVRIRKLEKSALMKGRGRVLQALIDAASNPSPRAATDRKLYFEMTGDYVPRQRVDHGLALPDDLSKMSEQELRAMASEPGESWVDMGDGVEVQVERGPDEG